MLSKYKRTSKGVVILAWNLPVAMLYIEYHFAVSKLIFMQYGGFYFALYDEKTKRAVQVTEWFYDNNWIFIAILAVLNIIFMLTAKLSYQLVSWIILGSAYVASIYFSNEYFTQIFKKVLSSS